MSPQVSLSRISSARLDHVTSRLTPIDQAVVGLVARARLCSGAQLERLFWHEGAPASRKRQARRVLARLTAWRLLERLPRLIGGQRAGSRGFLYTLGPAGVRLLARQDGRRVRRLSAPGERYLNHTLAITGLYIELVVACRAGRAELLAFDFEPACWRQFSGAWGATLTLKPDAAVRLGVGDYELSWLLELDLATESLPTIQRKAHRYRSYWQTGAEQHARGVFPRVMWIAPTEGRCEQIRQALARLPQDSRRLFVVATTPGAVSVLTGEADS